MVLFLHDYLLNRQMWKPQVEPLVADGFRVILVDLRGFGESELGKDPVSIPTYSTDIIGLLDYLGIGRAVICGLSFGASVLFDLMENYPKRIVGACLAASRAVADDSHERARRGELMAALERGELPRVKDELTHMLLGHREEALAEKQRTEVRRTIQALQEETLGAALQA
ncbi:MAG TPA: alpha/beta hydrolase, partial [Verrucomicrobiae bacterium]|nr:alpha/beta hydrolase [Verrucomicrobiae bacterium]